MRYRVDVMGNKRVMMSPVFTAEHTQQAVRITTERMKKRGVNKEFTTLFVMNEKGNVWVYNLQRKNGGFRAVRVMKANPLPKNITMSVFAGNTNIAEVV